MFRKKGIKKTFKKVEESEKKDLGLEKGWKRAFFLLLFFNITESISNHGKN